MRDIPFQRKYVNADKLHADIAAVLAGKFLGISTQPDAVRLLFTDDTSDFEVSQAKTVLDAHNPAVLTQAQQDKVTANTELLAASPAQVNAAIAQMTTDIGDIDTDLTAITADNTALAAAGTLVAVKPIVANLLAREQSALTRQKRNTQVLRVIAKALRWLANNAS